MIAKPPVLLSTLSLSPAGLRPRLCPPTLPADGPARRTWQLLAVLALVLGCSKGPTTDPEDPVQGAKCSNHTKCPGGYKCTNNPADPLSTGKCEYQECGLTVPCKTSMTCIADKESALCDNKDPDKLCSCVTPNSGDVPVTTGDVPTTGGKP